MFNLYTLIKALEKIGNAIPDVNTVVLGDIFELNSRPDIDYSVFAIVQDQHEQDDNFFYFNCYLYYIDRLTNDGKNRLEIQSHGCSLLSAVISKIEDLGLIVNTDFNRTYQPFNQRFSDECAGVYARVSIQVPIDCTTPFDVLVNPLLGDLAVYQSGEYLPADYGVDAFRVVSVSGQSYDYYTEEGKTAKIDNGFHTFEVSQNGVFVDGYPVINSYDLSAYTYNKTVINSLIEAALGNLDGYVAKKPTYIEGTSGSPADYNSLTESGYYYVNANNSYSINSPVSGWQPSCTVHVISDGAHIYQLCATQAVAEGKTWPRLYFRVRQWSSSSSGWEWSEWKRLDETDFVRTNPELHRGSTENINFNDYTGTGYYVIEQMNSASTLNNPTDVYGNAILHVIALTKTTLDDVLQLYYTADDNTGNTDIYLRRRYWDSTAVTHYWGQWIKISGTGGGGQIDTALSSSSTNPVENRVVTSAITHLQDEIDDLDNRYDILEALVINLQGEIEDLKKQISGSTSGETSGSTSGSTSGETSGGCVTVLFRSNSSHTDCFEDGVIPYGKYKRDLAITGVTIGSGITRIADNVFEGCSGLTSIVIPDSVTEIGGMSFIGCSGLTSVTIPSSVTSIEAWAFRDCSSLESISIPDSVTNLEAAAFGSCINATALTIGSGITAINTGVFEWCTSISCVTIPDSITSIGSMAFMGCSGLQTITIGNRVTSIDDKGFKDCTSLSDITCYAIDSPALVNNPFDRLPSTGTLHVPTGSDYSMWLSKLGSGWSVQYI